MLDRLLDSFLLNVPCRILAKAAIRTKEHLAGLFVAFQLPVEQSNGDFAEIPAVRLRISAAVPDAIFVCAEGRHFGERPKSSLLFAKAMSLESPEM